MTIDGANASPDLKTDGTDNAQHTDMKWIIQSFLDLSSYAPPRDVMDAMDTTPALEDALSAEVASWNADDGENGKRYAAVVRKAVALVQFFFPHHSLEVKTSIGMYAWFFFYIDDCAPPSALAAFHQHILLGSPIGDVPLQHLKDVLGGLYKHWDPVCVNSMIGGAFEFVTGSLMEVRPSISEMKVRPSAPCWPKYLRAKTGMAPGFSNAIFPKETHPDIAAYIQAIPDIDDWMCKVNDIVSHYKEALAGETVGYLPVRALMTGKSETQVMIEMVEEVGELHRRISATLKGQPEALAAWKACENGFIAFHFANKRYKLTDLGFAQFAW
ncbi:isoprenoid synthase domain-containing protein [Mycena crocata]|nr:isoprenoid synthase domain-containing protein [Mycena crocata]